MTILLTVFLLFYLCGSMFSHSHDSLSRLNFGYFFLIYLFLTRLVHSFLFFIFSSSPSYILEVTGGSLFPEELSSWGYSVMVRFIAISRCRILRVVGVDVGSGNVVSRSYLPT